MLIEVEAGVTAMEMRDGLTVKEALLLLTPDREAEILGTRG